MSGFAENPFSDPQSNPFADPSIKNVAKGSDNKSNLDNYNPFADNAPKPASTPAYVPPEKPMAAPQAAPQPVPGSTFPNSRPEPYNASQNTTEELQRRQQELDKKAEELAHSEQQMGRTQFNSRENNWPPLPFKCVPKCFYQDIGIEIPNEFQRTVKFLYILWTAYSCMLFLNVWGNLAYFIVDRNGSGGKSFGLSLLYFALFIPLSFVFWFRPVYKAFRSDSSINFFWFFFAFFCHFILLVIMAIGVEGSGSCGFIVGFTLLGQKDTRSITVAVIIFVIAIGIVALAVTSMILLVCVHRIYRSTGASFGKAQAEFASGVMSSGTVRTAAKSAFQGEQSRY